MCCSCGCVPAGTGEPDDDHGNPLNLTLDNLRDAAPDGWTLAEVADTIAASVAIAGELAVEKRLQVGPNPKRFVLGVAYPADRVDGHGEFMRADELEATAWDFNRQHRTIGFYHADGTTSHAEVVESYIHRGPDWVTKAIDGSEQVIKAGDWVLGAVFDDIGFEQVIRESADGWSIDGWMKRRVRPRTAVGQQ